MEHRAWCRPTFRAPLDGAASGRGGALGRSHHLGGGLLVKSRGCPCPCESAGRTPSEQAGTRPRQSMQCLRARLCQGSAHTEHVVSTCRTTPAVDGSRTRTDSVRCDAARDGQGVPQASVWWLQAGFPAQLRMSGAGEQSTALCAKPHPSPLLQLWHGQAWAGLGAHSWP